MPRKLTFRNRELHLSPAVQLLFLIYFGVIAFWIGPNLILFHKLTWITTADLVPLVHNLNTTPIKMAKIYLQTHEQLDEQFDASLKAALIKKDRGQFFDTNPLRINFYLDSHYVYYDLTPGHEGWKVRGQWITGDIPVPNVTLDSPTTSPASK